MRLFHAAEVKQQNAEAGAASRDAIERNGMADAKLDDARAHLEKALEAGLDHPACSHVATALWRVTQAQLYLRGG